MDVYLPIANLAVNGLWIIALGALTGVLSGLFGVGGGFLTTPLLIIFYGIPPTVAAASASTQVTGASVSGVLAHAKRGGVDYRLGAVTVVGGLIGAGIGALLFRFLRSVGQIDVVINALYVILLGSIGALMMREAVQTIRGTAVTQVRRRKHHPLVAALPWRWRFYRSGLYISPLAPLILGVLVGILTMLMGVGGGFILVPAMLYILGMSANVVVGTSLFNILFVTIVTTMMHSLTTKAVDIVLVGLLLIGSVTGAQLGTQWAAKLKPEWLRFALAAIVLVIAIRIFIGFSIRPDEIYTVFPL
ncbi:MAG: sulfite exporter TauE/SafE family protein [Erythrobacter sp.]|nr:sulfite exporter TauE/SafE family protein [Erythrobacter sp.]